MSSRSFSDQGRPPRPFGVWLAAGYALLFTAFMPLFTRLWSLTFPPGSGFESLTLPHLLHTAGMSITIAIAAVLAWRGNNRARVALVLLITLYYGLIAFENGSLLSANWNDSEVIGMFFMRMSRGIFIPAVFIWYFTEEDVKHFYGI
jgi:hypothetical protein